MDQEMLEEYKEHILELWHSEYPEEGEPYTNVEEIILDQIKQLGKPSSFADLNNQQELGITAQAELDENIINVIASDHFKSKPY